MTAPTPESLPTTENGQHDGDRIRLAHLRVGMPAAASDPVTPSGNEQRLRDLLAPFVAWLATQNLDEPRRRLHRDATERFLRWSHTDDGPAEDRRRRYERHLADQDPGHLTDARDGLNRWIEHRRILACTLPVER